MEKCLRINKIDNVAVAIEALKKGDAVSFDGLSVIAKEDIPAGHKIALFDIKKDESVIKYAAPIGRAKEDIIAGSHVHTHNLATLLSDNLEYKYEPVKDIKHVDASGLKETFMGYVRKNGNVGVRNEIWIIPTVGCVNNVAEKIRDEAKKYLKAGIDDVVAFTHPYGCSQLGDDQENTRKILVDLISHPNAGGVLVLGLGCENSNINELKKYLTDYDEERVKFLVSQECEDEIEESVKILKDLIDKASKDKREEVSVDKLIIGLKCGGSDGFSGITANPTVGGFSDLLVAKGGTTILTEVPEMFGAETLLMNRCKDEALFEKTVDLINNFKDYFRKNDQVIYENPSPGNKAGGISTLEDKSLGCTQKSGSSYVCGVLEYSEKVKEKGLNLLSAPGNDLVAATALSASGAQIVLFTTGRGTPFAAPAPTVKISSNTPLYEKKKNWIDFNAGRVLEDKTIDELSKDLYNYVLKVASGEKVLSEVHGFHDFAIFKQGVTL